jgi:hypothetical protein
VYVLKAQNSRANGLSSDNHMMFPMHRTNTSQWAVYLMRSHNVHDRGGWGTMFFITYCCVADGVLSSLLSPTHPFVAHTTLNVQHVSLKF